MPITDLQRDSRARIGCVGSTRVVIGVRKLRHGWHRIGFLSLRASGSEVPLGNVRILCLNGLWRVAWQRGKLYCSITSQLLVCTRL